MSHLSYQLCDVSLQATKLLCDIDYQGRGGNHPLELVFDFKISFRVIQRMTLHLLLSKMLYFIVKYIIAT